MGTEAMRSPDEIQRAHDMLVGIILGEVDIQASQEQIVELAKIARVMCWVLRHDHNLEITKILAEVELCTILAGYTLEREKGETQNEPERSN